jgi:predicted homoserine dehydrogenase-like protein
LRDVRKDEVITYDMVALDIGTTLHHLRALQDGDHAGLAVEPAGAKTHMRQLEERAV